MGLTNNLGILYERQGHISKAMELFEEGRCGGDAGAAAIRRLSAAVSGSTQNAGTSQMRRAVAAEGIDTPVVPAS